jgi:hypothetical protein
VTSARDDGRIADLRTQADHARRRIDLYRARAYGLRPVSHSRLRDLERQAESATARLRAALRRGSDH